MTPSSLRRTIVGAAITVLLSSFTLVPASAAMPATIAWVGSITDGATYAYGKVPAAPTCTATDDQVTPAPCIVTGYDTAVGTHTLTATATSADLLTPTVTETRTYTVAAWTLKGFYKPVKMGSGVWNKAKAGSTVPLKFKVYSGSTKLKGTGVVAAFTAQQVACTDPTSLIGQPMDVASGRKGFQLKYKTGAFHQNWKTPKAAKVAKVAKHTRKPVAATCYQVTMTTVDGSALTALFRLK